MRFIQFYFLRTVGLPTEYGYPLLIGIWLNSLVSLRVIRMKQIWNGYRFKVAGRTLRCSNQYLRYDICLSTSSRFRRSLGCRRSRNPGIYAAGWWRATHLPGYDHFRPGRQRIFEGWITGWARRLVYANCRTPFSG